MPNIVHKVLNFANSLEPWRARDTIDEVAKSIVIRVLTPLYDGCDTSGLEIAPRLENRSTKCVPQHDSQDERLGTATNKDLNVLCYQHHSQMLLSRLGEHWPGPLYVCREPGCLVRYDGSKGYFIDAEDVKTIEQETTPRISCPNDGHRMYLAQVKLEDRSFRLWKCPDCNESRTNDEENLGGLQKQMGA